MDGENNVIKQVMLRFCSKCQMTGANIVHAHGRKPFELADFNALSSQ